MRITGCPSCREDIRTGDVTDVFQSESLVRMTFDHECGASGAVSVTWDQYRELVAEHKRSNPQVEESDRIGRAVQGMRIELDAVVDLGDLLLVWVDQERHAPWTVRRERVS